MCPSISHITWVILAMYINKLGRRIGNERGMVVVPVFHPRAERRSRIWKWQDSERVNSFSRHLTPQPGTKQVCEPAYLHRESPHRGLPQAHCWKLHARAGQTLPQNPCWRNYLFFYKWHRLYGSKEDRNWNLPRSIQEHMASSRNTIWWTTKRCRWKMMGKPFMDRLKWWCLH